MLSWVAELTTIAAELSTNGGSVPIHPISNLALGMSGFGENGNLVPFVSGETCVGQSQCCANSRTTLPKFYASMDCVASTRCRALRAASKARALRNQHFFTITNA